MVEYKIVDIDYWENDAFLVVDGTKHYFQFGKKPNLKSALEFLFNQGKFNDALSVASS